MITEQDKQAILDGAYGVNRNGKKCKFLGITDEPVYSHFFVYYDSSNKIITSCQLTENFLYSDTDVSGLDVVGLWEDKPEPFDLERALNGDPVILRGGVKAYIKYMMPEGYTGHYPLNGFILDPNGIGFNTESWTLDGRCFINDDKNGHDIVWMWKDPEPELNTVTVTLPRALKEPQDEMWFVDTEGYMKSGYGKCVSTEAFNRRVFFGSEEDAKAWFDAMQNSRK